MPLSHNLAARPGVGRLCPPVAESVPNRMGPPARSDASASSTTSTAAASAAATGRAPIPRRHPPAIGTIPVRSSARPHALPARTAAAGPARVLTPISETAAGPLIPDPLIPGSRRETRTGAIAKPQAGAAIGALTRAVLRSGPRACPRATPQLGSQRLQFPRHLLDLRLIRLLCRSGLRDGCQLLPDFGIDLSRRPRIHSRTRRLDRLPTALGSRYVLSQHQRRNRPDDRRHQPHTKSCPFHLRPLSRNTTELESWATPPRALAAVIFTAWPRQRHARQA